MMSHENKSKQGDNLFKLPRKRKKIDPGTINKKKRTRVNLLETEGENVSNLPVTLSLMSMPPEIHHKVITYLEQLDKIALRRTSEYFEAIVAPEKSLKYYEVFVYFLNFSIQLSASILALALLKISAPGKNVIAVLSIYYTRSHIRE